MKAEIKNSGHVNDEVPPTGIPLLHKIGSVISRKQEQQQYDEENDLDEVSSTSSAQSIINAMQTESERRRAKLTRRKKEKLRNANTDTSASANDHSTRSSSSIMTVRTLEESLATTNKDSSWKNVVDNQRRRRRLRTRLGELLKDVNDNGIEVVIGSEESNSGNRNGSSRESDNTDNMSDLLSLGSSSANSYVSASKFDVRYTDVSVREYSMVAGDNPSVNRGPPVAIDWKHFNEEKYDIDQFEKYRQNHRRLQSQMKMPPVVRYQILKERGYSTKDIREITKEATIIRRQRIRSIEMMHNEDVEEKVETVKRLLMKPFKSRKERERENLLKQYYKHEKQAEDSLSEDESLNEQKGKKSNHQFDLDTTKRSSNYDLFAGLQEENEEEPDTSKGLDDSNVDSLDSSRTHKTYDLFSNTVENENPFRGDSDHSEDLLDVEPTTFLRFPEGKSLFLILKRCFYHTEESHQHAKTQQQETK